MKGQAVLEALTLFSVLLILSAPVITMVLRAHYSKQPETMGHYASTLYHSVRASLAEAYFRGNASFRVWSFPGFRTLSINQGMVVIETEAGEYALPHGFPVTAGVNEVPPGQELLIEWKAGALQVRVA